MGVAGWGEKSRKLWEVAFCFACKVAVLCTKWFCFAHECAKDSLLVGGRGMRHGCLFPRQALIPKWGCDFPSSCAMLQSY